MIMGFKQVLIRTICSHNKVDIRVLSECEDYLTITSKCLICGKQLSKSIVDKVSGTVEEIMW